MAEHDHILLHMEFAGRQRFFLPNKNIDFNWPPPERITFDGEKMRAATDNDTVGIFTRIRMSQLTDEQIAKCPGVARGAEYRYEHELPERS
jgi:hypothetical protein